MFCNLNTQQEVESLPTSIGSTFNLTWPCQALMDAGYRRVLASEVPQDGFRVARWSYIDLDGEEAKRVIAEVVDIVEEQNAQAEARAAAEIQRQASKPLDLRQAENDYISLCFSLTGVKEPLAPAQIEAIIKAMPEPQKSSLTVTVLYLFNKAQAAGGGNQPWADAVWHTEIE